MDSTRSTSKNDAALMDGLRANGISVPDTMSVTGFDGLPQSTWKAYDLTTIEQPMQELAQLAVETLVDRIENDEPTMPGRRMLENSHSRRRRLLYGHHDWCWHLCIRQKSFS